MNVLTYEQLKARLDAVVAECVLAKAEVVCWAKECDRIVYRHTNQITDMHQLEAVKDLANLTPNVTAALAEVEVKAIDKAIERITSVMKHPEVSQAVTALEMFVDVLEAFKKELREGRV